MSDRRVDEHRERKSGIGDRDLIRILERRVVTPDC